MNIIIDTDKLENMLEVTNVIAEKLNFPNYYGKSIDAWDECIKDMSWMGDNFFINVDVYDTKSIAKADDIDLLSVVFYEAAGFWRNNTGYTGGVANNFGRIVFKIYDKDNKLVTHAF